MCVITTFASAFGRDIIMLIYYVIYNSDVDGALVNMDGSDPDSHSASSIRSKSLIYLNNLTSRLLEPQIYSTINSTKSKI